MILLQGITAEELFQKIDSIFEKALSEKLTTKPKATYQYLSRKEVATMLHICLPTLHNWTKAGMLPSYRIGTRVLYKSNEIEEVLGKSRFGNFEQ
jgi:excisionase family DNA binding protein